MAKSLSEAGWTGFTKKHKLDLDDGPLVKALARLDKADAAKPDVQLAALDDVAEQVRKQVIALARRKKELGDKPFAEAKRQLDELLDEAEKQQKDVRAAAARAKQDQDQDDDEDDEPASALLDPRKLLAQLNLCKRDPERTVNFAFVDGKDKAPAVLAMSPKVAARKLFAKLQAETGVKVGAYGSAWVDGTSLMLQLDKPLSGLVKKIRAPVKECGFRIAKAVLWNADGSVFEQDDETDAPATPDTPSTAPSPASSPSPANAGAPKDVSIVKLQQARLAWDAARKKVRGEITALQKEILKKAQGEPDFGEIALVIKDFESLKNGFDEQLIDKLDEALNAQPEQRQRLHGQAAALIQRYQAEVDGHPLLRSLDDNPFLPVTVQATLNRTLGYLSQQLK